MFKKIISTSIVLLCVITAFVSWPKLASAQNEFFTFRSTVVGSGINQTGQYSYDIVNQKSEFSSSESVFFLTRIFNITNIDRFQFKTEIRGSSYNKDVYSPMYYPHRNWWAEIFYWSELGALPVGSYTMNTLVSVDGGGFYSFKTVNFSVAYCNNANSYQPSYPAYYPQQDNRYHVQPKNYAYNSTYIGKSVVQTGAYAYDIVNQANAFQENEDVYALAKITNISGIDRFQIKFDVFQDGNRYKKTNEVAMAWPRYTAWEYNHSWGNLGKLSPGSYEIRTSISIDGSAFSKLNSQTINVYGRPNFRPNSNDYRKSNDRDNDYDRRNRDKKPSYDFNWTRLGTDISFSGGQEYGMSGSRSEFTTDEHVKVLTKIDNIKDVKTFKIKHVLYKDGKVYRESASNERRPNHGSWGYDYFDSDFSRLDSDKYSIKTYISVNNGSYKLLDSKNFTVRNVRVSTQNSFNRDHRSDSNYRSYRDWNRNEDYRYDNGCTGYYSCQSNGSQSYNYWR